MPKKTIPAQIIDVAHGEVQLASDAAAVNALAQINSQQDARARAIADQIGYDGALTVDTLEDEIRFYQRRTVEACLELGKRLLVLKELTPHGEFEKRIDMLGFNYRSAARFMSAAAKTAKSANLSLLSTQVKSMSAFLELVTQDDDTLAIIAEMDDIDRMSASELRARLRETDADLEQARKRAAKLAEDNAELAVKSSKKIAADTDWPDALIPLCDQIAAVKREIDHAFSKLETARITVLQTEMPEDQRPKFEAALKHVAEIYASALASAERHYLKEQVVFAQTLGSFLDMDEM